MGEGVRERSRLAPRLLVVLAGALLLSPAAAAPAGAAAASSTATASATQQAPSAMTLRVPQRNSYAQGFGDGYDRARRDAQRDCRVRHRLAENYRNGGDMYDRGFADGYAKGSEAYCPPGTV
jgi:hypothetical protein